MRLIRLLLLALLVASAPAAAQTFPKFTGLVVDAADVIPPAEEAALTAKLEAFQRETKRQLVVATIPDLQGRPIEDYGYQLGRAWGVGLRDVDNGAILFVAPNEPAGQRGPRIEVGTGLEGVLPDVVAERIIRDQMMPRLRANDIPGALTAGTDALVQQLRASPDEASARTDAAAREFDRANRRSGAGSRSGDRQGGGLPFGLIFFGIVLAVVVIPMLGARGRRGVSGERYRSKRRGRTGEAIADNLPIILWTAANVLGSSRGGGGGGGGGGWGGGGDSGGGWSDGGFSGGGGGGFSGGGASGEW